MGNLISQITSKKEIQVFILIGFLCFLGLMMFRSPDKNDADTYKVNSALDIDTLIPEGFVLIPIEIINKDAIKSLIGEFGIIDLYSSSSKNKKANLVIKSVKVLRSPYNKEMFAVLLQEHQASKVLGYPNGFYATIKNSKNINTHHEVIKKQSKRKIIIN